MDTDMGMDMVLEYRKKRQKKTANDNLLAVLFILFYKLKLSVTVYL